MDDLISRQAAIQAILDMRDCYNGFSDTYDKAEIIGMLEEVPSAQPEPIKINIDHELTKEEYEKLRKDMADAPIVLLPTAEPLTDTEQRIFLAAMGREEKVCKQVDDECRDCREPYEDSLVRTCHEITRKVKGALWTI